MLRYGLVKEYTLNDMGVPTMFKQEDAVGPEGMWTICQSKALCSLVPAKGWLYVAVSVSRRAALASRPRKWVLKYGPSLFRWKS